MAMTRSKTASRRTRKQIYRARVKKSPCRGRKSTRCYKKNGCKNTKSGKRRSYCRKRSNARTMKGGQLDAVFAALPLPKWGRRR